MRREELSEEEEPLLDLELGEDGGDDPVPDEPLGEVDSLNFSFSSFHEDLTCGFKLRDRLFLRERDICDGKRRCCRWPDPIDRLF